MAEKPVISVRNLSKSYRIYDHPLARLKQALSFGTRRYYREFEALQDISFDIYKGETVGIIGRNGSGKSTLLQLICGIRKPTRGEVTIDGRVSALLELGAGFHPEFTGRENVYMQGAIMGYTRQSMEARFDEIAAFADIGDFIEQPVKTYSSGMFVRLAFATAVSVEPDILVVDEALAVGDMAFQQKSFDHLSRMIKRSGMTVILVSHELRQIQRFCPRAILLDHGRCVVDTDSARACQMYYEMSFNGAPPANAPGFARALITGTDEIALLSVQVLDSNREETRAISSGDPLLVRIRFRLSKPMPKLEFVVGTQATDLAYLSSASTAELDVRQDLDAGEHEIEYMLDAFPLAPGRYFVRFNARDEKFRLFFVGEALKEFDVIPEPNGATKPLRLLNLNTTWRLDQRTLA